MLQFQDFPIFTVYSLHRQMAVDPLWKQYYRVRENAKQNAEKFSGNTAKVKRFLEIAVENDSLIDAAMQWQLTEDLDPKYRREIHEYESTIIKTLTTISHTSIGKKLLDLINKAAKIWVIPTTSNATTATTFPFTEAQGGGIRINFNPHLFRRVYVSPRRSADEVEDTLFHEMVHAMRFSQNRFLGKAFAGGDPAKDFGSSEEFIAEQLANVYHSSRRTSDVYSTYKGEYRNKKNMYQYFVDNAELVMALKFFLQNEPLAQFAAGLHQPDFNPFRDYKEIERRAHGENFMPF